jgi:hypothetical protein
MQFRPTDTELLDEIASLLEERIIGAVGPELRHEVRVAASLARILQRQTDLQWAALERERVSLSGLLGRDGTVIELRRALDERLRGASGDDPDAWAVLVAIARDDVAIAKPGYDAWEGE